MEALSLQDESLTKLAGVLTSVEALMTLMDAHVSEASSVAGGVPLQALVEQAGETKAAVLRLRDGMRIADETLQQAKAAEEGQADKAALSEAGPRVESVLRAESHSTANAAICDTLSHGSGLPPEILDESKPPVEDSVAVRTHSAGRSFAVAKAESHDRFMFYPSWTGKLAWDLFVMLIVVCDAMVLPFQLSFKHGQPQDGFDTFWFWCTLLVFSSDCIGTFNTAIQSDEPDGSGECSFNTNRREIAIIYLKGWFTIDFVSTFPWSKIAELLSDGQGGVTVMLTKLLKMLKFARIIRLMKMLRARKIKEIWEKIEVAIGSIAIVQCMMLLRILLVVVAICHWFACLFWIVGSPSSLITELLPSSTQEEFLNIPHWTTVMRSYGPGLPKWSFQERSLVERYLFCFYWTLGVMRTMPAEVTPVNLAERVFVLLFMFFALSAFAISVASLTQAYFKINERGRSFGDEMFFIRMHLSKMKMDEPNQRRIKDYLHHLFERRRILAKEANLLDKMPEVLKKEVHGSKIMLQLNKLSVIQDLSRRAIRELCETSTTFDLMPEQTICTAGEVSVATWIICTGVVSAKNLEGELVVFEEPLQVIDEDCLCSDEGVTSELTVTTLTCCEVVKIEKQAFVKLVAAEQSWATKRGSVSGLSGNSRRHERHGGPQKIEVQDATDNSAEENGAASAAAAALSA